MSRKDKKEDVQPPEKTCVETIAFVMCARKNACVSSQGNKPLNTEERRLCKISCGAITSYDRGSSLQVIASEASAGVFTAHEIMESLQTSEEGVVRIRSLRNPRVRGVERPAAEIERISSKATKPTLLVIVLHENHAGHHGLQRRVSVSLANGTKAAIKASLRGSGYKLKPGECRIVDLHKGEVIVHKQPKRRAKRKR